MIAVRVLALLGVIVLCGIFAVGSFTRDPDTLVVGLGAEPGSLDPARVTSVVDGRVLRALFEGLTTAHPESLKPQPGCAESWVVSPDGRRIEFSLREDLRWSNGDPLTAEDFRRSWLRLLDPTEGCPYAAFLWGVSGARAFTEGSGNADGVGLHCPDALTLIVELDHPVPYFLSLTSFFPLSPVHGPSVTASGGSALLDSKTLVSNGPYRLSGRWLRDRIRVEKNDDYWNTEEVPIERIDYLAASSPTTLLNLFLTGEADWITRVPPSVIPTLRAEARFEASYAPRPHLEIAFYRVNVTRAPWNDLAIRQALSLSLDRQELVERITGGGEQPAWSFVPWPQPAIDGLVPGGIAPMSGYTRACLGREGVISASAVGMNEWPTLGYDPEAARKILAEAGYRVPGSPTGEGLPPIEILYPTSSLHGRVAEWIQATWGRELGLTVHLRNAEGKSAYHAQTSLDYDVSRSSWVADYLDPMTFLEVFASDSGTNRTGWQHLQYDSLLETARTLPSGPMRSTVLFEAERVLLEQGPVIPLWYGVTTAMVNPELGGLGANALDQQWPAQFYWQREEER